MADGDVRALGDYFEIVIRYNGSDFQDDVLFNIQACHFKVYPDQRVAQFCLLFMGGVAFFLRLNLLYLIFMTWQAGEPVLFNGCIITIDALSF